MSVVLRLMDVMDGLMFRWLQVEKLLPEWYVNKGRDGVTFWAVIAAGSCCILDGVEMNADAYITFVEKHLEP